MQCGQITISQFTLTLAAGPGSADGQPRSIAAKPRRGPHSGHLRLSFVYKQSNPDHAITDEERHVGVANLIVDPDERTSNAQDLASNG